MNIFKHKFSLHARLVLPFVLLLLVAAALAWWVGVFTLTRVLEQRLTERMAHTLNMVAAQNFPLTSEVLHRIAGMMNSQILLLDNSGAVILGSVSPGIGFYAQQMVQEQKFVSGKHHSAESLSINKHNNQLILTKILEHHRGGVAKYLLSFTDLSDLHRAADRGALLMGFATLLGVGLIVLVGYRVARSITEPISAMTVLTKSIASGDRDIRMEVQRDDEVGELSRLLNSMITELAQYEQKLSEASRQAAAGSLSAKVAHEIRNPLTAIKMQLELLSEQSDEQHKPKFARLLKEVERLELIVSTTLQVAQPERLMVARESLLEVIKEVVELLSPQLSHRSISMKVEGDKDLPDLLVDANKIKQVFINLVLNAAEEMQEGGQVKILVSEAGAREDLPTKVASKQVIEIHDSGPGVSADLGPSLFEHTQSRKPHGFGMGLVVSKTIVQAHGGDIRIGSSLELKGAVFVIELPLGEGK